jgi:hypothetical protein
MRDANNIQFNVKLRDFILTGFSFDLLIKLIFISYIILGGQQKNL